MPLCECILDTIGKTPLIKLNRLTKGLGSSIYVKVESFNPGGSTKDRMSLAMIEAAEREGALRPGGTIIEATAGNTGIGLAIIAAIKGYRCVFVLPDKTSSEKVDILKAYGAEIVLVPAAPRDSPENWINVAERLSHEIPNSFRPDQFGNQNNPMAHYLTTGPEIWRDMNEKLDVFVAGIGTGGTITGVAKYLKEQNPNIYIVGADPEGSIFSGDTPKQYLVEGIGEDFIPHVYDSKLVDKIIRVSDKQSFTVARSLAKQEGILVGGSSGAALAAALNYASTLTEPKRIVVLLPDTGRNYISKVFSDSWMSQKGLFHDKTAAAVARKQTQENENENESFLSFGSFDRRSSEIRSRL